jgi:hypothetical protein
MPNEERRAFAQTLIDEIGAAGPETAEETARRAVEIIRAHRALRVEPDPIRAIAESMAGSLTGGEGRHVTEWRTPSGLLRVTVEVEP